MASTAFKRPCWPLALPESSSGPSKPKLLCRKKGKRSVGCVAECHGCGLRTVELAKCNGDQLLCRLCVRLEDELKLQPSEEEQMALDQVPLGHWSQLLVHISLSTSISTSISTSNSRSSVLDSVPWSFWKSWPQKATKEW